MPDHRRRVAAERRERMRARLIEAALIVFAEKGVGASVIQDVISAAQVSQGTFYNYFRTNEELLAAVAAELSNELVQFIESTVSRYDDAATRIAVGVRLYLYKARAFPLFGRFVVRTGYELISPNNLIYEYVPQHLNAGYSSGRLQAMPVDLALDLISGFALAAIARMVYAEAEEDYPEQVVAALMRALGLSAREAERLARMKVETPELPEDALAVRASMRAETQQC